jgi:hypothetical protein
MMRDIENIYSFKTKWPKHSSLVELAQTPPFKRLFARSFKTIILETFSMGRADGYWRNGTTPEQLADEMRQFEQLTRHLPTTYRDSGKTFVLQNWESDWAARGHTNIEKPPTPEAFRGLIAWLNARQEGVERAQSRCNARGSCAARGRSEPRGRCDGRKTHCRQRSFAACYLRFGFVLGLRYRD